MKKTILFVFAILLLTAITDSKSFSQNTQKYSEVRIFAGTNSDFARLTNADLHIDHAIRKENYIDTWLSEDEIKSLQSSGVGYQILINDWDSYYRSFPKMTASEIQDALTQSKDAFNVSHSIYGSMGGFLKYSEVNAKLDSMRLQYPSLISTKFTIGTTAEGRSIWTVKLTLNPDMANSRPQVWYHALIHAREPESMEHLVYYMYWLMENYNIDPLATYILKNRELYFTLVLNPDGYVYNETTNPTGGGLWRKNRKNNGGSFGIDVNRNYGLYAYWNSSNGGSSTTASSDTYRGVSPFSELESIAAMNFINSKNIQAVFGAHTYGNYLIKPWAWQDPTPTPDDNKFNTYLKDMSKYNSYTTGTPSQTVGYYVRGGADDWYYNDSVHSPHRIMAMTPESGTTGFWPTQAEIIPLAQEMLMPDQYMSMIGGAYVTPDSLYLNKNLYTAGESGTVKIKLLNKGVAAALNTKVTCTTTSYYLNVPITFYNIPSMSSFGKDSLAFGFTLSSAVPANSALPLKITIYQEDSSQVYTVTKYILTGNGTAILADSAENGFTNWTTNQGWATTTTQSHTPTRSYTDSPSGNYVNNANNSMTLTNSLNVSSLPVVSLNFWHRYATEAGYDFCNVEVSSNNGTSWQLVNSYNGTLSTWTQQTLDITSFANSSSQMKIRFTLKADGNIVADGWYVDDIKLTAYNLLENAVPTSLNLTAVPEGLYNLSTGKSNLKDTVKVILRKSVVPYLKMDSAVNVIDSLNLTSGFNFYNVPAGNYYIVVLHRNSIETWSKNGGEAFSFGGNVNYNFTTSSTQAYGNNLSQKGTLYCLFSGDVNQDGVIDATDLSVIDNDSYNSSSGYLNSDINGDYFIDGSDAQITDNNAAASVVKISP